ncbi:MAG: hypothetical protein IKY18_02520 [Oscillospiraceae bacterium]|nr:hypothetical protein [Oscillospiraceae bacterium]
MKRFLWILLAIMLLAGCSKKQPSTEQSNPTIDTIQPTEPGLYVPGSAVEKQTSGAVRSYSLKAGEWFGLSTVGENVLVIGNGELLLLTGEQGWTTEAEVNGLSESTEMDTYTTGVGYYDATTRTVTVLDAKLQLVTQKVLPEDVEGAPVISMIRNEAYYFNGTEIRAMELTAGATRSRLLRQQKSMESLLPDDYFDGNVLSCQVKDAAGEVRTEYFSSETGQTYSQDQGIDKMQTFKDQYFIERMDIHAQQLIFGARNGEKQSFLLQPTEDIQLVPVLEMSGVVTGQETEQGLELSFYDLKTGKCTAQVVLPDAKSVKAIQSKGAYIWILAQEGDKQTLLRWDITKSAVTDENVYIGPFYTPENPDEKGLKECVKLANTFETTYRIRVHIGTNAMKTTGDYKVVAEHQPQNIRATLESVKPVLEKLKPVFASYAGKGKAINLCFVRSIESGEEWVRFQYNKTWWFLISAKADLTDALISGMTLPIESHVIGNSRDYEFDRWNPLNPAEFVYANVADVEPNPKYLQGNTRAFVDAEAMTSISEDRRSIIYNAMLADNAEMFRAPTMQAKLHRICIGIREAYDLQKSENTYLWEQYLETSLAYVKK